MQSVARSIRSVQLGKHAGKGEIAVPKCFSVSCVCLHHDFPTDAKKLWFFYLSHCNVAQNFLIAEVGMQIFFVADRKSDNSLANSAVLVRLWQIRKFCIIGRKGWNSSFKKFGLFLPFHGKTTLKFADLRFAELICGPLTTRTYLWQ